MGLSLRPNLGTTKSKAARSAAGISSPEPATDEATAPSALSGEGSCGASGLSPPRAGCARAGAGCPVGARRDAASHAPASRGSEVDTALSRAASTCTFNSRGDGMGITIELGAAVGACAARAAASGADTTGAVAADVAVETAPPAPAPEGRSTAVWPVDAAGGPLAGGPVPPRKAGPAKVARRPLWATAGCTRSVVCATVGTVGVSASFSGLTPTVTEGALGVVTVLATSVTVLGTAETSGRAGTSGAAGGESGATETSGAT